MEIRQLRYFLSVVRRGSLVEAAREHFVTQPAVSIQLKKLEDEMGEKLYFRRDKRVVPTDAGQLLARQAEEVVRRIDALTASMQRLRGGKAGYLRLGNIDAASIYVLPGVFRAFRRRYPGVDIQVTVADTDSLIHALEDRSIELAIVTLPHTTDGLAVVPFYRDDMVLVADKRHELVTGRVGRGRALRVVAEQGLITYPSQSTTRRLIERVFLDNGLTMRAAMEMSSPEAIKKLTEAGLGASILPRKLVASEIRSGQLRAIPTGDARFFRMLGVVYSRDAHLSESASNFLSLLTSRFRLRMKEKVAKP